MPPAQATAILRIFSAVLAYGSCRPSSVQDLECGEPQLGNVGDCLTGFTASNGVYDPQVVASPVVSLMSANVALPDGASQVQLLDVLPCEVAVWVAVPSFALLRDVPVTVPRPLIQVTNNEYVALLRRLHHANMITFVSYPMVVNGLFGTPKPDGATRLIVDARPANAWFQVPPKVVLPSPEVFSHYVETCPGPMFVAKSDLDNYYYRLKLPLWMIPYFALPPVDCTVVREVGAAVDGNGHRMFPCMNVLPMGWAFSVYLAQLAHETIVYRSGALSPVSALSGTGTWSLRGGEVKHLIYIDDVVLFGKDCQTISSAQTRYLRAMEGVGLVIQRRKVVRPTTTNTKVLGFVVNGGTGLVRLHPDATAVLRHETRQMLQQEVVAGTHFQRILGKWIWAMLLCRPSLAILAKSFRFARCAEGKQFVIWPSVRCEMELLLAILPMLRCDVRQRACDMVVATDASLQGFGVTSTVVTNLAEYVPVKLDAVRVGVPRVPGSVSRCLRYDVHCLQSLVTTYFCVCLYCAVFLASFPILFRSYLRVWQKSRSERRRPQILVGTVTDAPVMGGGVRGSIQAAQQTAVVMATGVATQFVHHVAGFLVCPLEGVLLPAMRWVPQVFPADVTTSRTRWRPVFMAKWRHPEHINVLELRAVEVALRWCASRPRCASSRLVFLSDSQVVVAGLRRGRSSSYSLLSIYRRITAVLLMLDSRIIPVWIRSRENPADGLSRGIALPHSMRVREVHDA